MNTVAHRRLTTGILAVGVSLVAAMPAIADTRPWQIDDTFRLQGISDLQPRPDGDELAFVVSRKDLGNNASYSTILTWSADRGSPQALTDVDGHASSPRWSPAGDRIAYFASDGDGRGLWVMNADGSGKKRLATAEQSNAYLMWGGTGNKLAWSPDGKTLAYNAAGPRHYPQDIDPPHLPTGNDVMVIDRLLHKSVYFYSDLRRTHIWTIPSDGGKPKQLTSGDTDYHSFAWSPDGSTIACVSNQTGNDDFNANNDILFLSVADGSIRQVTSTVGPEYQVGWSPDGSVLAYEGRVRAGRSKESDAELVKIYTRQAAGGRPVELTGPLDRWANGFRWGPAGRDVYVSVQDEGRVDLYAIPAVGGTPRPIVSGSGQVGDFAVAGDGSVYYVHEDFTRPAEIYRVGPDGAGKRQLTRFNETLADEIDFIAAEPLSFRSFDGLRIDGWIMRPSGIRQDRKYPLILHIHGGPHGQLGDRLSPRFQTLAANGYVVLFFNPRGSTGRGQAFSDLVVGDIAGGDFDDVMLGLDFALENFGYIDAERMGVTGTSYGGYLTNWAVVKTDRFRAAVPVSGISNLISAWSEGSNPLWYESDMEMMPFEDYEKAWAVSPLKYVANAKTPTLFINGRWDFITSLNQADAMFVALKKLGVDTQIALYPHEGHGVGRQPRHRADYHARMLAWFDRYLK